MKNYLYKIIGAIVILGVIIAVSSGFLVDIQWFKEVGYLNVFMTTLTTKILVFVPTFIIFFASIVFYVKTLKSKFLRFIDDGDFGFNISNVTNKLILGVSSITALIVSALFTGSFWYKILEFVNATPTGVKDPIFSLDASFYMFKLPLVKSLLSLFIFIVIVLGAVALIFYFTLKAQEGINGLRGVIDIERGVKETFIARQLAILGAFLLVFLSLVFVIKALELVYSPSGVTYGAGYTDIHVSLPAYGIIAVLCIVSAIIFAVSVFRKKFKPVIYSAVTIVVIIFGQALVAGVVEKFIVTPNARDKEMPYITNNIKFTRKAFGLENIEQRDFPVQNNLTPKDIENNKLTIDNIRINEFDRIGEVYNQIQAIRNYYTFNNIDIDRYTIDGKLRQVLIAPRELDNSNREEKFQTWQNRHLFYTHGYGIVASYSNSVGPTGLPSFISKDIPVTGPIKVDKPQIYFGELTNDYSIVGAKSNEIDHPSGNENKETRYNGKAGINLSFGNRVLFAVNQQSINFLLSSEISSKSKIILHKNIVERVNKIAPFIHYDRDPYLVASNGKLYWIINGYTTSNKYPYSEMYGNVNYVRNSVKAVIDAYDGTVDFYLDDNSDVIASTISKMYKGLFKDISKMPEDLKDHLRYSEDVFMAQSRVYEKYHMTNPMIFYNNEDLWSIARYKGSDDREAQIEPVYQLMKLPQEKEEKFLLTIPYTVAKKENMVSWLTVEANEEKSKLVLLKFPKEQAVYGPQQFNSKINTDTEISQELTLWSQRGSEVKFGEATIIPIKNSLLYVKPLYLKSQGGKGLPELKRVIVQYGDKIVMEENIPKALARLFGANIVDEEAQPSKPGENVVTPSQEKASDMVKRATDLFNKATDAQKKGDWAAYGTYLKQLEDELNKLQQNVK
ncbi:UPF0182 family protein [Clostridium cylindrosporum]|uniref:UPF0182 protein CLCY_14c00140 n=1 Tax=Clostridium cylindrosporum DSM 605 TaxID=1121307 RepID=A0A0J8G3Y5_CLOCY|nr:UPF0182 family protein [Clostridium cylindrosporum]KMT22416.1 hypothetical protein CLCY_14c00140 [Clostridium cylindrosporum DSM 605]